MSLRRSDDQVPYNVGVIPNWWIEEAPHDTLFVDSKGNRKLVQIENPRRKVSDSEEYDEMKGYDEKLDASFSTTFSAGFASRVPNSRPSSNSRDLARAQSEAVLPTSVKVAQEEWTALRKELAEAKQIIAARDKEIKDMTEQKKRKVMALEQTRKENIKQEKEIEKLESQINALGSALDKKLKPPSPKIGRGKLIRKTGVAFKMTGKYVLERAKSLAGGSFSHKSTWDEGVEIIDSLLVPESETFKAMTVDQRRGLKAVKWLLMRGGLNPEDQSQHIPMDLIKNGSSQQQEATTTKYLLREFGGVRERSKKGGKAKEGAKRKRLITRMKHKLKKRNQARAKGSKNGSDDAVLDDHTERTSEIDEELAFTPPEFKRLSKENQIKVYKMLSWNNINKWDFNIFDLHEATEGHPLLFMGWAVLASPFSQFAMAAATAAEGAMDNLAGYNFIDSFNISEKKLIDFLRVIEEDYCSENPYHNEVHAADVVQSLHTLIQMKEGKADIPDIQLFSILLAAVVHDVNHPGENNAFQVKTRTDLALTYNDESVLENWHVSHAFTRMLGITKTQKATRRMSYMNITNEESDLNILSNVTVDQFVSIRSMVIEAVLHTDMTKHFAMVNSAKALHLEEEGDEKTWKTLMFMLHLADISNPAKPSPLFELWTDRCLDEFFAQGDRESRLGLPISPNCDRRSTNRAGSQIGFINFVILPAYEVLSSLVPSIGDEICPIIRDNCEYWKAVSEEEKERAAALVEEQ